MKRTNKTAGMLGRSAVLVLGLVLAGVPVLQAQRGQFTFTTIDVHNALASFGEGVATDGTVAGAYLDQSFVLHGFLRSPAGVFTNPLDVPASAATFVLGIDPPADFVDGIYLDTAGNQHGFVMRLSDKSFAPVDFSGAMFTVPFDINTSGEIVGVYLDSKGKHHGFSVPVDKTSLSIGTFQSIDFPGAGWTAAFGINDYGDIVGFYIPQHSPPQCHSFRVSGGNFTILHVSSGGADLAMGINDIGNIAGIWGPACPFLLANPASITGIFLRSPAMISSLVGVEGYVLAPDGTVTIVIFPGVQSTQPSKINVAGMIVGFYNAAPGPGSTSHAFLAVPTQ